MTTSDNSSEVFARPNAEARIHDLDQFTLWADTPERPNYRSRMTFGERNGAPRITVFTNFENTPKPLWVGFHPMIFMMFLQQLGKVANGECGKALAIDNNDLAPGADKNAAEPATMLRNKLWFGKDNDGVIWLGVEQAGIKNIRFKLLPSGWHNFYKDGGIKLMPSEASLAYTMALIECLRMAYTNYIGRLRPPYDKNAAANNNAKKGNAGTTFGAASISTFEEDIKF